MSHIYADGAEVLKALDEQGGGPKLASLGDYGIDHHRLLDQLRILEKPVIDRQELRVKSIEKIAMERHAVVFEQLVEERIKICLLYTSPSPRDGLLSRMPSSA